jgi:hypothetical protein
MLSIYLFSATNTYTFFLYFLYNMLLYLQSQEIAPYFLFIKTHTKKKIKFPISSPAATNKKLAKTLKLV